MKQARFKAIVYIILILFDNKTFSLSIHSDRNQSDAVRGFTNFLQRIVRAEPKFPSSHCCLIINKINIDNPGPIETKKFIGGYKLILASNRDEMFSRPTNPAQFWHRSQDIIGGQDMEPGKEGGTWLAMKKDGKLGTLLNIFSDVLPSPEKLGRGFLVNDFLTGGNSGIQYAKAIQAKASLYTPFNLVTIELKNASGPALTYYSSKLEGADPIQFKITGNNEIFAFGNSVFHLPFQKVLAGKKEMEEVARVHANKEHEETLISELLKILKCRQKYFPDTQMQQQAPSYTSNRIEGLTSKFVCFPSAGYGSRTHTIILVDDQDLVQFLEWTLETPIDCANPKWKYSKYEFRLESEESK